MRAPSYAARSAWKFGWPDQWKEQLRRRMRDLNHSLRFARGTNSARARRMRSHNLVTTLLSLTLSACVDTHGEPPECSSGKCDGVGVDQTCSDPHYGDGVCQVQLDCAVPDIDCFHTFATDADAKTWFSDIERQLAVEQQRAARTILPETDPRFQRARALLDRGWDAFRVRRPVGMLAAHRPALVLLEDPVVNAFVAPDYATNTSAFSVQVQTGLLAGDATDDVLLGVMMHELQHAAALHLIGDTKDRLRTFFVASDDNEPFGFTMAADPYATAAGVAWRELASQVGPYSVAELGGMPLSGELDQILVAVIESGLQNNANACANAVQLTNSLRDDIKASRDPLDSHLTIDLAQARTRATAALTALRTECLAGFTRSFIEVLAALSNTTPAAIEAALDANDRALVTGKHVIDAIAALVADRRARMRATEQDFERATDEPWTHLRYFSYEEDADDVAVTVLRASHVDPAGNATFLRSALPAEARTRCDAVLDANQVPHFGVDLFDEHHSTCWRVYHSRAMADRDYVALKQTTRIEPNHIARLPLPRTLGERIIY
jgi:hypothetical protein